MNILVSACLLGVNCRYDGTGVLTKGMTDALSKHHLIPVCPEQLGGLMTPRTPAERVNDKIMTKTGEDVTENFKRGATEVLKLAKLYDCKLAILKERSPSCGYGKIYDGTFTNTLISGNGLTAELLSQNGIKVIGEHDYIPI